MQSKLAAFKVFRRSATVAIFSGQNLDFVDVRHLSNVAKVATETLERFIDWIIHNFDPQMAALASEEDEAHLRTKLLTDAAEHRLLQSGIPIWRVTDRELLASYAIPALTQKQDLRRIARVMWGYVADQHQPALDAALVGLYVQVERLLSASENH